MLHLLLLNAFFVLDIKLIDNVVIFTTSENYLIAASPVYATARPLKFSAELTD